MDSSDQDLIARFRGGDAGAFDDLARRWDRRVYNLAYRVIGDAEEAGDVRQLVLLRTYQGLASFNGHAAFATWMYRVVLNLCRGRLRSRRIRERQVEAVAAGRGQADRQVASSEMVCQRRELGRQVAEAVAALPQAQREVVVLRHYQGLTFGQIAEVLETPVTTVKSRMGRALRSLRQTLKDVDA